MKKVKLPRKRKKRAIKAQGRKWYYDTISFFYICQNHPGLEEKSCKFWDNSSIRTDVEIIGGVPYPIKKATRYF